MTGVENVLAAHWSASTHTESKPFVDKCDGCGEVILTWGGEGDTHSGNAYDRLAKHQAEALTAAGFGNLHDAWAEGVATALNHAIQNDDGITLRLEHLDGRPWTNPYPAPKVSET